MKHVHIHVQVDGNVMVQIQPVIKNLKIVIVHQHIITVPMVEKLIRVLIHLNGRGIVRMSQDVLSVKTDIIKLVIELDVIVIEVHDGVIEIYLSDLLGLVNILHKHGMELHMFHKIAQLHHIEDRIVVIYVIRVVVSVEMDHLVCVKMD